VVGEVVGGVVASDGVYAATNSTVIDVEAQGVTVLFEDTDLAARIVTVLDVLDWILTIPERLTRLAVIPLGTTPNP
jgi:hypothetical protein